MIKEGILLSILLGAGLFAVAQEPVPAEPAQVNTKYNEVKPVLSPDGNQLFFARSNHPGSIGGRTDRADIWSASIREDSLAEDARHHGAPLNTARFDAVAGFSADGSYMYLIAYDSKKVANRQSGIYRVQRNAVNPSPEALDIRYFLNKGPHFDASVSTDGQTMILSMESYSTYGLEDLYVSHRQSDGNWSEPRNLGNAINTPRQEMAGFLAADGRTLYFTSNRAGGLGSMDIWASTRLDDSWKNWSKPVNLGSDVNTGGADMYYWEPVAGDWAYFSSTQNSEGYGDIRRVRKPEPPQPEEPVVEVEQDTVDADTSALRFAEAIEPEKENALLAQGEDAIEPLEVEEEKGARIHGILRSQNEGSFTATVKVKAVTGSFADSSRTSQNFQFEVPEAGAYRIRITAPGYFAIDSTLEVGESGILEPNFRLRPLTVGTTVRLDDVMFRQSTAVLMEGSEPALDEVVRLMLENPNMEILLTGHTDNQGSSKANLKLSRERVEAVKNYLISRGVEADRIEGKGFGGSRPVASNANEETRKLNRRVEFTIRKN